MREKLWEMVRTKEGKHLKITNYDRFMIGVILVSIIPLCFHETNFVLTVIDKITAVFFIFDYIARWVTADFKYKFKNQRWKSFCYYPITAYAIVDLLSIIPSVVPFGSGNRAMKLLSLLKAIRVFRVLRYSSSFNFAVNVFRKEKQTLIAVFAVALGYIGISAVVLYQVEPGTFNNMFDAIYWATTELTTVGYGDIYPQTVTGRLIGMFSSFIGIAVVALPAGVITAGFMTELSEAQQAKLEAERKLQEMQEELERQKRRERQQRAKRRKQAQARQQKAQQLEAAKRTESMNSQGGKSNTADKSNVSKDHNLESKRKIVKNDCIKK